ncbi:MAG: OB-fold nucleic acid binding domain-containing protein [Oscillospiraceae bacterium]
MQLHARQDEMDEAAYQEFKKYDIGDIVGVDGEVFRTQRGEMSVRARTITLLSKSFLPLPEKPRRPDQNTEPCATASGMWISW